MARNWVGDDGMEAWILEIVQQAKHLAAQRGFQSSCLDEVGRLLALLAGQSGIDSVLEIGTGCGVSTGWLASAAIGAVYSVEQDPDLARQVRLLFADWPQITVLAGDWQEALRWGPYGLVFVDAKPAKQAGVEAIVDALSVGGLAVLDDFTPVEYWPPEWRGKPDTVRDAWLHHPRLLSTEIRTSEKNSVIVARRMH